MNVRTGWITVFAVFAMLGAWAEDDADARWLQHFSLNAPAAASSGSAAAAGAALPTFKVTPAKPGRQLVRFSAPFAPGALAAEGGLAVLAGDVRITPDFRVLTCYPGSPAWVRRALVTFSYTFPDAAERTFTLEPGEAKSRAIEYTSAPARFTVGDLNLELTETGLIVRRGDATLAEARLDAPPRSSTAPGRVEALEQGRFYGWARLLLPDAQWPRIIEVRADALGTVAVRAHVQRLEKDDGYAPDLGWTVGGIAPEVLHAEATTPSVEHAFSTGTPAWVEAKGLTIDFPDAHLLKRGKVTISPPEHSVRYVRCFAEEQTPQQETAWRTATVVFAADPDHRWNALLEPLATVRLGAQAFAPLYGDSDRLTEPLPGDLGEIVRFHCDAIAGATLLGDDFGNITSIPTPGAFGMNRLNHCPAILRHYYDAGDARLRAVALHWCDNLYDLSIWWGERRKDEFGGTRYNNVSAMDGSHKDDKGFMWRSNSAVHFCTKGYDTFFQAYEETGDPRMAVALRYQTEYAAKMIHTDQGECRNIGDAADFVRLFEYTGNGAYREEALRLFRELRTKLSTSDLFSQGGQPIVENGPFIDDDDHGYKSPFAKPYIIGYALQGLPFLAKHTPDEPKLRDVIRAVADFMARSQDPVGGWRYPHPRSSRVMIDQAMEHAMQLSRAAGWLESRGEPIDTLLDAIERALQARVNGYRRSGTFLSGLKGWEASAGAIKQGQTIYDLYKQPGDRDPKRDYTEGAVGQGGASPEGAVHFVEVLAFYLKHRPAERLAQTTPELAAVIARMTPRPSGGSEAEGDREAYTPYGIEGGQPLFAPKQIARMTFPMAFDPASGMPFEEWRKTARAKVFECLQTPPPAPADYAPKEIGREDRGTYEARKLVLAISGDTRIPGYLLAPKGPGPFPAIIALHDHGAHFSIGKEKVIRPFGVDSTVLQDAQKWVDECYDGRWIGDALAARGYVVFAIDALYWGERGQREGASYEAQQRLAANILQIGMTWLGAIAWDDIRATEFVASLPYVDAGRIGAIGLSMGAHRTWMLSALSDRIAAGAAICWMCDTKTLQSPGNNQTTGQSAFSMLAPGLRNFLDYPDVAALACPKPMLFYNGEQDSLFPVPGVRDAYARMRRVWDSQGRGGQLATELWPVPHVFNRAMQDNAFAWLDAKLRKI
jgi:dienelactone hydrolase